jgi:hypothetical protein
MMPADARDGADAAVAEKWTPDRLTAQTVAVWLFD